MRTVTSLDGTAIAFDVAGDGPALIVVDGPLCHRGWGPSGPLAHLLADRLTVFTYDRRGRGESDDVTPYAVEREVEDLDALVQRAGGSAYVYGSSSGAVLALEAARRGVTVTKLAAYEPPFIVDDWRQPLPATFAARLAELVSAGRRGDALDLFMTRAMGLSDAAIARLGRVPAMPALETLAHTLVYDSMIMAGTQSGAPLPPDRWSAVAVPTLVIHGEGSDTDVHTAARALARTLPYCRRRTVDGQHHRVAASALAPVLDEFFAS
jgi:pimeloyl-ACP methyl ester carboxylesterase